jgi:cellulose synthase operon protein B
MFKRLFMLLLAAALCTSLIIGWIVSAQAQSPSTNPTATPSAPAATTGAPTLTSAAQPSADSNVVSFAQLGRNEIQLVGPYDSAGFSFFIPADWKLQAGADLNISVGVSFNNVVQSQSGLAVTGGGGTLTARLNGITLGVLPLNQVGEVQWKLLIAPSAFTSTSPNGGMSLRFVLNSGISCIADQNMNIFIHPSSYLTLPHNSIQPDTSLVNFPRPIYQGSFKVDSALLVIPVHPSPAELQAALTVAAGLGNLSSNKLLLNTVTVDKFFPDSATSPATTNHIIFVGKPSSLSVLTQLHLPSPVAGGQFQISGGNPDDGYVQMIDSPWDSSRVVLVVSGNTDAGITKAAQAVSTGLLRPNRFPNMAVIQQVQSAAIAMPQGVDETLVDLGYQGDYFTGRGSSEASYTFNIHPGYTVAPEAYFELVYGHSALLNYDRSSIVVSLNNRPIGSIRMSDQTANNPTNHVRFTIPASAVQPGKNTLLVDTTSIPIDDCTPTSVDVLWINLLPQSTLHLPLDVALVNPISNQDLASYPAPFVYDAQLSTTAFVFAHDDLGSWDSAVGIAEYLGFQASGSLTELSVFYGDNVPASDRAKDDLIIIGRPSQIPLVGEMNKSLPAPFTGNSDVAADNSFQVTYRIPPNSPLGYLETLASPWNPNRTVLAVLGNEAQGVSWAAASLINPALRSKLGGNFAVVNASQVITTDTRTISAAGSDSSQTSSAPSAPQSDANTPVQPVSRPIWLLPVLILTILLVALILGLVLAKSIARGRDRKPRRDG